MMHHWNKEVKRLIISLAMVLLLGIIFCGVVMDIYCGAINKEFNLAVASMLDCLQEAYPEASGEELMEILGQGGDGSGKGEELLGKYGIFPGEAGSAFPVIGKKEGLYFSIFSFGGLLTAGGVFFVLLAYLARRQREIGQICTYMDEVGRGNFSLDMSDNRDSELSSLKNELYKLTIFLKEQAREAVENRKALADAMADISHQLKTPLTSVTVLVDNLTENQNMDIATRNRFLREISNQLSGVTWLVATLLKLSRLDAGVVELERKPLELKLLVEETCGKLELLAEWRQVELVMEIPGTIWISGDTQWLTEAFLNLVKNAIEHSVPGGKVELTAEENEVYTLVTVRDYGEGMDAEEQRHLFERFYRGRSAGADSVGIGLALSKEIIARQGGYITAESGEGQGTAFFIKFIKCH